MISFSTYDWITFRGAVSFSQVFGYETFEKYLELGLNFASLQYFNEEQIKTKFSFTGKVPDYLVIEDHSTIIIEAKAVEASRHSRIYPSNKNLSSELNTSIIKATIQAFETAQQVQKYNLKSGKKLPEDFFLLIVTYKDLYLGPGNSFWEEFLQEELKDYLLSNQIDPSIIRPENMFYISVDCFDRLMHSTKNGNYSISNILSTAAKLNINPKTSKFLLDFHINDSFQVNNDQAELPYLEDPFNKITEDLKNDIQN